MTNRAQCQTEWFEHCRGEDVIAVFVAKANYNSMFLTGADKKSVPFFLCLLRCFSARLLQKGQCHVNHLNHHYESFFYPV
jgi:hypothetical protein